MAQRLFMGLMSGTSLDGIDGVLIDWSENRPRLLASHALSMPAELRARLLALQASTPDELHSSALAANELSHCYARVAHTLLQQCGLPASAISAIGNHGQTIRHRPELGYTIQLGNNALLAELTGITVVGDFRSRDISAGGQGAPLVPAFHQAMFAKAGHDRAVVNIGGFANLSWLAADGSTSGWDTGPGNVLLDLWINRLQGHTHDHAGQWAAQGQYLPDLLEHWLSDPFFSLPPPKSTGRDYFNLDWLLGTLAHRHESAADIQATLSMLTARSIACELGRKGCADTVYVCGGGARNTTLLRDLAACLKQSRVTTTAELGIEPQWVEAYAFSWLAACCIDSQPASLPDVTGARGSRVLGAIWPA